MPNIFQTRKPKSFNYKPRFYSEEKERMDELRRRVEASGDEGADLERRERMRQELKAQRPNLRSRKGLLSRTRLLVFLVLLLTLILILSK